MTDEERLAWLRLARTERVGPVAFENLLGRYGSAEAVMAAMPEITRRSGPLRIPSRDDIRRELDAGQRIGARLLCSCEPAFPHLL
ncbi:MAG: dprA, partial [Caulobacter sp.]|nr:dprA [Caulobacter sp.]